MIRFCAIFSILVGFLAVLFCIGSSVLAVQLGGGLSPGIFLEVSLGMGPIGIAGILIIWSGVQLLKSLPSVQRKSVVMVGIAWGFGAAYCIRFLFMLNGGFGVGGRHRRAGDPFDEGVIMFVFVPMAILLLVAIEFEYLRRKSKPKG